MVGGEELHGERQQHRQCRRNEARAPSAYCVSHLVVTCLEGFIHLAMIGMASVHRECSRVSTCATILATKVLVRTAQADDGQAARDSFLSAAARRFSTAFQSTASDFAAGE